MSMRLMIRITLPFLLICLPGCSSNDSTEAPADSSSTGTEDDPGVWGPQLGQAHVVRSLTIKASGGMNETFTGTKEDGKTTLSGECKPDLFANLSLDIGESLGDRAGIAFATEDPIMIGQTGEIDLDWVMVDSVKINNADVQSKRFKSDDGTLTITQHDPTKGSRRMTGTIVAKNLEPLDGAQGPPVNVEASFDMDFSCGVK